MLSNYESVWKAMEELETNAIVLINPEGHIENANMGLIALLGYSKNDVIGERVEILLSEDVREIHRLQFDNYIKSRSKEIISKSKLIGVQRIFPDTVVIDGGSPKQFSAVHKNGQEVPISLTINEIWSDTNDLIGFIAIISSNEAQYKLQQQLRFQANYDQLTGLISWQKFFSEVHAVKKSMLEKNTAYYAALLFIDVDYFKILTYHSRNAGDYAIKKIASWLLLHTRQKDERPKDVILTYFLGDVFIVYLPGTSLDGAVTLARRLKSGFMKFNLRTKEHPFFTSISIGAAKITHNMRLHEAVSQASYACMMAKGKGKNKIEVVRVDTTNYLQLEPVIRGAIQRNKIELYAQKIVAISPKAKSIDMDRAHYEVLIRMQDKKGDFISPAVFMPASEVIGLAVTIDSYVIEHALAALKNNSEHEKALSICSINLSGISVANEQMFSFIEQQIRHFGIDPGKLCFEITETSQILDNEVALCLVSNLRKLGCKIAFDDFGIGFSNYQSFSRLPVDIVKIDGSYVRNASKDNHLKTDMQGMINSAKVRGLEIIGEFAENEQIVRELEHLGVDYVQGYYWVYPDFPKTFPDRMT